MEIRKKLLKENRLDDLYISAIGKLVEVADDLQFCLDNNIQNIDINKTKKQIDFIYKQINYKQGVSKIT